MLKEGAALRIPSADEIFQISRSDALSEVQRQHSAWGVDSGYTAPADTDSRPGLTLVPPDEDPVDSDFDSGSTTELVSREDEIAARIIELETADVSNQQSLIEIRDNELASLRQELADIRGEIYVPPFDEAPVEDIVDDAADDVDVVDEDAGIDDVFVDSDDILGDDSDEIAADADATDDAADVTATDTTVVRSSPSEDKGIVEQILEFVTGIWGIIIGSLILVAGALIWFMKRGSDGADESGPWGALDDDSADIDLSTGTMTATMQAPTTEDAIVVVEQDSGVHSILEDTIDTPASSPTTSASSSTMRQMTLMSWMKMPA